MNPEKLPLKNLLRQKKRTVALLIIIFIMTVSLFGGSIFIKSLNNGLDKLDQRLGANIIVLPEDAKSEVDLKNILLQGTPGYFYMDKEILSQLEEIEAVKEISPQYFLVSANAECCSVKVQIIGFDEDSDFTIKPWLHESYNRRLTDNEIIVGSALVTEVGHVMKLYGNECLVVGRLEKTGTGLDTAVYTTNDTVKNLILAARDKGINVIGKQSPDDVLSSVYINIKDGYDIDEVVSDININYEGVKAVRSKAMMTSTSERLKTISSAVYLFIKMIWVFLTAVMIAAFCMITGERKREFAALRVIGLSKKKVGAMVLKESLILGVTGAGAGILITVVLMNELNAYISSKLDIPYLIPGAATTIIYVAITFLCVVLIGSVSGMIAAFKAVSIDTGKLLRE